MQICFRIGQLLDYYYYKFTAGCSIRMKIRDRQANKFGLCNNLKFTKRNKNNRMTKTYGWNFRAGFWLCILLKNASLYKVLRLIVQWDPMSRHYFSTHYLLSVIILKFYSLMSAMIHVSLCVHWILQLIKVVRIPTDYFPFAETKLTCYLKFIKQT